MKLPKLLRQRVPLNFRTTVFCLLAGLAIGLALSPFDFGGLRGFYRGPLWLGDAVWWVALASLLLLPVWCVVALRSQPLLLWAGVLLFLVVFAWGMSVPVYHA